MIRRAEIIRKMHDDGMTYAEIGLVLGVSAQAVHQMAENNGFGDGFHESAVQKVKYPGLRKWMLENHVCVRDLERMCGKNKRFYKSLIDKANPSKKTIDAILAVTGLTYEECFKEEENVYD